MARNNIAKKVYVSSTGEETRSPTVESERLEFRFSDGTTKSLKFSGFPDEIQTLFGWNGLSQKVGDSYANAESVDDAIETFEGIVDRLMDGEWTADREGGVVHTAVILEAIRRTKSDAGQPFDEAATKEKLKGADYRKMALDIPEVALHQKDVLAERAAERAKKAREALKPSAGDKLAAI